MNQNFGHFLLVFFVLGQACLSRLDTCSRILTVELITIFNIGFPVARLSLYVEGKSIGAADCGQARHCVLSGFVAPRLPTKPHCSKTMPVKGYVRLWSHVLFRKKLIRCTIAGLAPKAELFRNETMPEKGT